MVGWLAGASPVRPGQGRRHHARAGMLLPARARGRDARLHAGARLPLEPARRADALPALRQPPGGDPLRPADGAGGDGVGTGRIVDADDCEQDGNKRRYLSGYLSGARPPIVISH